MAEPEEALKLKIWERDDIADILAALNIKVPDWAIGALIWYFFSKFFLDSLSPKKPGTEINLAIMAASYDLPIIGKFDLGEFPPGIKLAAFIDVVLSTIEFAERTTIEGLALSTYKFLARFGLVPTPPV